MQSGQRIAVLGMVVSGAPAVAKITAGLAGHSTAVVAGGLESAGDVFASGFVLLGLTMAAKPPGLFPEPSDTPTKRYSARGSRNHRSRYLAANSPF
ncbi:MAG TPA: cation transporter [Candidatus Saccharimonadales bacterium]|nr:cation transporter [Candidatus Saccharimonadales bacterium]